MPFGRDVWISIEGIVEPTNNRPWYLYRCRKQGVEPSHQTETDRSNVLVHLWNSGSQRGEHGGRIATGSEKLDRPGVGAQRRKRREDLETEHTRRW